jgi:Flp pilus assembly protein TadG
MAFHTMKRNLNIRKENGQAMVELTLLLPLLFVIMFGVVQFGITYKDYITLTDATRVGARKAAVSRHEESPEAAATLAVENAATGLDLDDLDVSVDATSWEHGATVTVEATYPYEIDLFGFVFAAGDLRSETTERVE